LWAEKLFLIIALIPPLCYPAVMTSFSELDISPVLAEHLASRGITAPTKVQKEVIPILSSGSSVFFRSETGTGKTLCYLLPTLTRYLAEGEKISPWMLIIAPTHELASQIKGEAGALTKAAGIDGGAGLLIGGAPLKRQIETLKAKPAVVVGGPARLLELIRLKKLHASRVKAVVLDETDRMLAPEMRDILREILSTLPREAQYIACSATLSKYHANLLSAMLPPGEDGKQREIASVDLPPEDVLKRNITHWAFFSEGRDKIENLRKFLVAENPAKALVFTSIVGQVENIAARLAHRKVSCAGLHAKLDKVGRKKAIDDFRAGRIQVLVTSDLAARGLDIPDITHVIQLDVNENEDFFVHRAGRTARAGKSGINAVFGDEVELRKLARVEKRLGIVIYPKILWGGAVRTPEQEEDAED